MVVTPCIAIVQIAAQQVQNFLHSSGSLIQGDLIQPTAIHAAAFAYGPLFRALDATERFQRQKQFEELAAKVSSTLLAQI